MEICWSLHALRHLIIDEMMKQVKVNAGDFFSRDVLDKKGGKRKYTKNINLNFNYRITALLKVCVK